MKSDELDQVLDGALARYSSEDPLAGMEQRVLNRVRAESAAAHSGRWRFPRWASAVGVAVAGGILAVAVWWPRPVPRPFPRIAGKASWPVRQQIQATATPARFRKKSRPARRPVPLPKRAEFPTPAPASDGELALLAWVARAPDQAREALLGLERRSTEPIQVAEIRIEPIIKIESLGSDDAK